MSDNRFMNLIPNGEKRNQGWRRFLKDHGDLDHFVPDPESPTTLMFLLFDIEILGNDVSGVSCRLTCK